MNVRVTNKYLAVQPPNKSESEEVPSKHTQLLKTSLNSTNSTKEIEDVDNITEPHNNYDNDMNSRQNASHQDRKTTNYNTNNKNLKNEKPRRNREKRGGRGGGGGGGIDGSKVNSVVDDREAVLERAKERQREEARLLEMQQERLRKCTHMKFMF